MAMPEKALLDMVYLSRSAWGRDRVAEMRFQNLEELDRDRFVQFARRFDSPKVLRAAKIILIGCSAPATCRMDTARWTASLRAEGPPLPVGCGVRLLRQPRRRDRLRYRRHQAVLSRPRARLGHRCRRRIPTWLAHVEHLKDDLLALRTIHQTLRAGGRLLVPAHPFAYGALDEDLEHFRRYTRAGLEAVLREAGYEIESTTRANSIGLFGWWFNGRILRRRHMPSFQAKINNMIAPLLRLERVLHIPFGLSLVVVAKRPG